MKKLFVLLAVLFSVVAFQDVNAQVNSNHVWVDSHTKSDGSYVSGHYRTAPNKTINDNFSTYPNYNPYTGKQGTRTPEPNYYNNTIKQPRTNSNSYTGFHSYPTYQPKKTKSPYGF